MKHIRVTETRKRRWLDYAALLIGAVLIVVGASLLYLTHELRASVDDTTARPVRVETREA